jgi:hypothetical protein
MMSELLNIGTEDVYEVPMLAEAGDFTDRTQGYDTYMPEGNSSYRD